MPAHRALASQSLQLEPTADTLRVRWSTQWRRSLAAGLYLVTAASNRNGAQRGSISQLMSGDTIAVILIFVSWLTAIILADPSGEFPSVDDWAYHASVRALIEKGELVFSDWSAQNLISHLLWGALFSLPFGVSYLALRISTLVASALCALALYRLMREADQPPAIALIVVWLLLFNPMFFALSFTFMTDMPFLAAQTGAMLFILRGLRTDSSRSAATGWTLAAAAQFCRQAGLAIPIAYAGAYLAKHKLGLKRVVLAVLPFVAFLVAQQAYEFWLTSSGKMSAQFGKQLQSALPTLLAPEKLAGNVVELVVYAFFYLGLFLLPLSIPLSSAICAGLSRKTTVFLFACAAGICAVLTAVSFYANFLMPVWTNANTWRITGIGPDVGGIRAPDWFVYFVTILSIAGGVLLIICIVNLIYRRLKTEVTGFSKCVLVFGLIGAVSSLGILSIVEMKFDRYLLPIIPWLALALVAGVPASNRSISPLSFALSGMLLAGMMWYSIVSTHNYMAEKRVWAGAIADLVAHGIPRETIDGGWVFNGDSFYGRFGSKFARGSWIKSRDYLIREIGCDRVDDYEIARRYAVPRWPFFGDGGPDLLVCTMSSHTGYKPLSSTDPHGDEPHAR